MTVLSDIDDARLLPPKQEIADSSAEDDSDAEPHVICHEDEHEEVA
jgi:hypothetical protein